MDIILSETKPPQERNRVRKVLVRYCGRKKLRTEKSYLHPENAYLVKYFPKYYQSLALQMKSQHSLLSKIRSIKKLKTFTGRFNVQIPRVEWFKILGNNRKEIEQFPQVEFSGTQSFWAKTSLHAVKFFSHILRLKLPTYYCSEFGSEEFLEIWKPFSKYLRNMRRLRILKMKYEHDPKILKSLFNKLNGMPRLLGKLEVLKSRFSSNVSSDILQNRNAFSNLTDLTYFSISSEGTRICQAIPQVCKKLKSFSLLLDIDLNIYSQSLDFITSMQEFSKLQSIMIDWSRNFSHDCWFCLIPPASLQNLKLDFIDVDLIVFKNSIKQENLFDHWREIKKLDTLDMKFNHRSSEEVLWTKNFMTALLKKVSRLASFACHMDLYYQGICRYEPFNIEEVPHLYKHLERFKAAYSLDDNSDLVRFDFGFLKPLKNLKEIDFEGSLLPWTNIGEAVCLLEENMKNGEYSTLRLEEVTIYSAEELGDVLKKISNAKKIGTHLKIVLALEFYMKDEKYDEVKSLDQFCEIIESKAVKGLEISLMLRHFHCLGHHFDEVKKTLEKYPGLRNFMLKIFYKQNIVEYIKRDGEKEQLLYFL